MTQDEIIRMARVADPFGERGRLFDMAQLTPETLVRFAALVAAAERDACAKACEETRIVKGGEVFAAKIRARGNT